MYSDQVLASSSKKRFLKIEYNCTYTHQKQPKPCPIQCDVLFYSISCHPVELFQMLGVPRHSLVKRYFQNHPGWYTPFVCKCEGIERSLSHFRFGHKGDRGHKWKSWNLRNAASSNTWNSLPACWTFYWSGVLHMLCEWFSIDILIFETTWKIKL